MIRIRHKMHVMHRKGHAGHAECTWYIQRADGSLRPSRIGSLRPSDHLDHTWITETIRHTTKLDHLDHHLNPVGVVVGENPLGFGFRGGTGDRGQVRRKVFRGWTGATV